MCVLDRTKQAGAESKQQKADMSSVRTRAAAWRVCGRIRVHLLHPRGGPHTREHDALHHHEEVRAGSDPLPWRLKDLEAAALNASKSLSRVEADLACSAPLTFASLPCPSALSCSSLFAAPKSSSAATRRHIRQNRRSTCECRCTVSASQHLGLEPRGKHSPERTASLPRLRRRQVGNWRRQKSTRRPRDHLPRHRQKIQGGCR